MTQLQKNIEKLEHIKKDCSVEGWDGYSGSAISESLFQRTQEILEALPEEYQPGFIAPVSFGIVQFEYEHKDCYLELEIWQNHIQGYVSMSNFEDENLLGFTANDILQYVKLFFKK